MKPQVKLTEDGVELSSVGVGVRTLDELLDLANVNRDEWNVVSYKVNKWDMPVGGGGIAAMWQVKATLAPRLTATAVREDILAEIAGATQPVRRRNYPDFSSGRRHLLEIGVPDLHLGMRAYAGESKGHYDLETGGALFEWAIETLIQRAAAWDVERIVFPIGNDFLHFDTPRGETTRGTLMETSALYHELFRAGWTLLLSGITRLSEVAPVDVILVRGNHDYNTVPFLAEVLSARLQSNANVSVDTGLYPRKYYKYGSTLLGFTHGHDQKAADLPLLMAQEASKAWSETRWREWHMGHFHHLRAQEVNGVRLRWLSSLAAKDDYHTRKGWIGAQRTAEAFLWDFRSGYAAHLSANVEPSMIEAQQESTRSEH